MKYLLLLLLSFAACKEKKPIDGITTEGGQPVVATYPMIMMYEVSPGVWKKDTSEGSLYYPSKHYPSKRDSIFGKANLYWTPGSLDNSTQIKRLSFPKKKPKIKDSVRKELHIYGIPDGTPWNQFNRIDSSISDSIPYEGDTLNIPFSLGGYTGLPQTKHTAAILPMQMRNIYIERNWYYDFDRWGRPIYFPPIKMDTTFCNKCWPDTVYSKTGELLAIMQYNEKHEEVGYLLEQTHKIIPVETRDTSQVTILINTDLPCGTGCFLTGAVKAWRITIHVPYQKLESDFFVEKHDQVYYYDQSWKRIRKYYPTPIKEGW